MKSICVIGTRSEEDIAALFNARMQDNSERRLRALQGLLDEQTNEIFKNREDVRARMTCIEMLDCKIDELESKVRDDLLFWAEFV